MYGIDLQCKYDSQNPGPVHMFQTFNLYSIEFKRDLLYQYQVIIVYIYSRIEKPPFLKIIYARFMGSCKNSKMNNSKKKVYLLRFNAAAPNPMHIYIRVKQLSKHLINMSCDGLVCSAIFSHKKHFFNVGNKKHLELNLGCGEDGITFVALAIVLAAL